MPILLPPNFEPLRTNRWILRLPNTPEYLVSKVNLEFSENNTSKLYFSIFNTTAFIIDPNNMITLNTVQLDFLDPCGEVVGGYILDIGFEKMELNCSYSDDSLLTHIVTFHLKSMTTLYGNITML